MNGEHLLQLSSARRECCRHGPFGSFFLSLLAPDFQRIQNLFESRQFANRGQHRVMAEPVSAFVAVAHSAVKPVYSF